MTINDQSFPACSSVMQGGILFFTGASGDANVNGYRLSTMAAQFPQARVSCHNDALRLIPAVMFPV